MFNPFLKTQLHLDLSYDCPLKCAQIFTRLQIDIRQNSLTIDRTLSMMNGENIPHFTAYSNAFFSI